MEVSSKRLFPGSILVIITKENRIYLVERYGIGNISTNMKYNRYE